MSAPTLSPLRRVCGAALLGRPLHRRAVIRNSLRCPGSEPPTCSQRPSITELDKSKSGYTPRAGGASELLKTSGTPTLRQFGWKAPFFRTAGEPRRPDEAMEPAIDRQPLAGRMGELRLGRGFADVCRLRRALSVFGAIGIATVDKFINTFGTAVSTLNRSDNQISYFSPEAARGLYGRVSVAPSEGKPGSKFFGTRAGYLDAEFDVSLAYSHTPSCARCTRAGSVRDVQHSRLVRVRGSAKTDWPCRHEHGRCSAEREQYRRGRASWPTHAQGFIRRGQLERHRHERKVHRAKRRGAVRCSGYYLPALEA